MKSKLVLCTYQSPIFLAECVYFLTHSFDLTVQQLVLVLYTGSITFQDNNLSQWRK